VTAGTLLIQLQLVAGGAGGSGPLRTNGGAMAVNSVFDYYYLNLEVVVAVRGILVTKMVEMVVQAVVQVSFQV
jgi:hypothetical protein